MKDELSIAGEKDGVLAVKAAITSIWKDMEKKCSTISVEVKKSQHRYVIGPRGNAINEILSETGVFVEMPANTTDSETITLRGPQEKLGLALTKVYEKANSVVNVSVACPTWLHKYIIGKKGTGIQKISQDLQKVHIVFNDDDSIKVDGPPDGVEKASKELNGMVDKMENEKEKDLIIENRFHRQLIGPKGENIEKIRKDFVNVQISFPDLGVKSDIVKLRGPKKDVDDCSKYFNKVTREMAESSYQVKVPIFKQFHKFVIGKGGANIRRIRDETDTKIDLPDSGSDSD